MQMMFPKKIGKTTYYFTVEGKNLYECTNEMQKLSFPDVPKCGICGDENIVLGAHEAQKFEYTTIRCLKCKASINFGQQKGTEVVYLRKTEDKKQYDWKKYEGDAK
jgi:hypothetical protein